MKKRILSLLLMLCMLMTLLPQVGLAEDNGYDIWVNGIRVTDANKENITGVGIDGKVSYDPVSNTLTLDGAKLDGSQYLSSDFYYHQLTL